MHAFRSAFYFFQLSLEKLTLADIGYISLCALTGKAFEFRKADECEEGTSFYTMEVPCTLFSFFTFFFVVRAVC